MVVVPLQTAKRAFLAQAVLGLDKSAAADAMGALAIGCGPPDA